MGAKDGPNAGVAAPPLSQLTKQQRPRTAHTAVVIVSHHIMMSVSSCC